MTMDNDTKITYGIILAMIVLLAGLAYFLQGRLDFDKNLLSETSIATSTKNDIKLPIFNNKDKNNNTKSTTTPMQLPEKFTKAIITTNKGEIEIMFATNTPKTVENFAKLASSSFYNGTRFHRVIRDFMIQGGDPLSKDVSKKDYWGTGGPGYKFEDEIHENDNFVQGVIAMANSGPGTNGSQFFIVTSVAGTPWLKGKHTIFGHVTKGLDIALLINNMQTDTSDRPLQDVVVEKVEIK